MRQRRARSFLDAAVVLACEVGLVVFFWGSAHLFGTVDYSHFGRWVQTTSPGRALGALARLLGLAVSAWLLGSSVLYALAALTGKRGLLRSSGRVTLPLVRRVVDALAVASVTASTIGAAAGSTLASAARLAPIVQTYRPSGSVAVPAGARAHKLQVAQRASGLGEVAVASGNGTGTKTVRAEGHDRLGDEHKEHMSTRAEGRHLPHPGALVHDPPPRAAPQSLHGLVPSAENGFAGLPKGTKVVVVQPGDCLSVIAEKYLGDWRLDTEIAELNYGRLQPDGLALVDDHWIYPGWVLVMPADARGTLVVGESTHPAVQANGPSGEITGAAQGDRPGGPLGVRPVALGREGERAERSAGGEALGQGAKGAVGQVAKVDERECASSSVRRRSHVSGASGQGGGTGSSSRGGAQGEREPGTPTQRHGQQRKSHAGLASGAAEPLAHQNGEAGPGGEGDIGPGAAKAIEGYDRGRERKVDGADGKQEVTRTRGTNEEAPASAHKGHGELEEVEAGVLAGLGAVAAAGLVWRLQRARRDAAHSRPSGFVPPRNRPKVQEAERRARAVASEEALRWVDLGTRYLGALVEQEAHDAGAAGPVQLKLSQGTVSLPGPLSLPGSSRPGPLPEGPEGEPLALSGQSEFVGPRLVGEAPGEPGWESEADEEAAAFERWWSGGEHTEGQAWPGPSGAPQHVQLPSLVMARVGGSGLEVVLEPAPRGRLGWFLPVGTATGCDGEAASYVLGLDIGLEDLEALSAERWPAWPALVVVGLSGKDTVLLNLEHAGVLSVEGPEEMVKGFLAGVLVQLASQPWADEMLSGLYAVGASPLQGKLGGRAQHVPSGEAMELAEKLDAVGSAREELSGDLSLSVVRALAYEALPHVAVAFADVPAEALRCLAEAAVPERSGVALVAAGPVEGALWKLGFSDGGRAVLRGQSGGSELVVELVSTFQSEEVSLLSEALSRPEGEGFVELDGGVRAGAGGTASAGASDLDGSVDAPGAQEQVDEVGRLAVVGERREGEDADLRLRPTSLAARADGQLVDGGVAAMANDAYRRGPTRQAAVVEAPAVEIRFLGPVDVVGGDMNALSSSRIMAALGLLAYLASRSHPVPADELASALWPLDASKENFGGPQRKTVMNVVSRARSVLGYGPNGKERIVLTPRGYQLSSDVGSDWDRFNRYVAKANSFGPGPEAVAHLRCALELVRGEPFGGVLASQFFEWVASENLDMVISARLVDVAEQLGELALRSGDLALVVWAVEKGLQIEPTREELFRLWMNALGREGRPAKVDDVYRRLKLVLRQRIHPLQEPQPASREVWQRYVAMEGATRP